MCIYIYIIIIFIMHYIYDICTIYITYILYIISVQYCAYIIMYIYGSWWRESPVQDDFPMTEKGLSKLAWLRMAEKLASTTAGIG